LNFQQKQFEQAKSKKLNQETNRITVKAQDLRSGRRMLKPANKIIKQG